MTDLTTTSARKEEFTMATQTIKIRKKKKKEGYTTCPTCKGTGQVKKK